MPPPPDAKTSYLQMIRHDMAQRATEYDEFRRLKIEIAKRKLELELAGLSVPSQPSRRPVDFYVQQITAWFDRLPPEARKAPRTMEEFINLLQGRTPGMRAHAPDVSQVLSGLGWVRRRDWKANGEGRRLWWPPV